MEDNIISFTEVKARAWCKANDREFLKIANGGKGFNCSVPIGSRAMFCHFKEVPRIVATK